MDKKAMYKLSYGLFVLTAKEGTLDNGCIINTAIQAASSPNQLSICVNKANHTHDMIAHTGEFNVSVISQRAGKSGQTTFPRTLQTFWLPIRKECEQVRRLHELRPRRKWDPLCDGGHQCLHLRQGRQDRGPGFTYHVHR